VIDRIYVENGVGRSVMEAINLFTPKHGAIDRVLYLTPDEHHL
jgi:hypothetical protein